MACAACRAPATEPLDDLFAEWIAAAGKAESLVVEFGLECKDTIIDRREKGSGTFRLIRTKKGDVFASYEVIDEKQNGEKPHRFNGLLSGGKVYWLNVETKTAVRFEPADGEVKPFLEKYFNPFVVLLDRKRAEAKCTLEVIKQDKWYTYLSVTPKKVEQDGWPFKNFRVGRIALMRKDSEAVPKGMPRKLWYTDGTRDMLFDIKAWRLNPVEAPKPEEFTRPEDRPGWKVLSLGPQPKM